MNDVAASAGKNRTPETIFLGSEIDQCPIEKAAFSVLPVPFEHTVSYGGGTGLGPAAILEASHQLETWDNFSNPSQGGIHTCETVAVDAPPEQVMENIAAATKRILAAGSMPVVLGGEHSVTYGVIKGYLDAGVTDFGVVQIDAHADLRHEYEGSIYSHASVMKRVVDEGIPLYQLGIRAYCEEERDTRNQHPHIWFEDGDDIGASGKSEVTLPAEFPSKVFFTVDVDGLDPSVFPSTGTPVPGGLGWYQTLKLVESVAKQRQIIGFDVMEFAPIEGFHAYDFAASLLVYKMMGIVSRQAG